MTVSETIGKINRIQESTLFKIAASIVVAVAVIGALVTYTVLRATDATQAVRAQVQDPDPKADPNSAEAQKAQATARAAADAINRILDRRTDPTALAVGGGVVMLVALAIIWGGLGITYFLLLAITAAVVVPLSLAGTPATRGAAVFIGGLVAITASFAALMRGLKLVLGGTSPVLAIARNVVDEAVRMKVSLIFMIMLIVLLASIPSLLDPLSPLRYRIQSFLQYANGGSFTLIAVLSIFLAVGTVAFEQRDKVIWQTMTKPVAHWKYLLGKWIGVSGVGAALLGVSASGVFLFAEYLRSQPASGEVAPYVTTDGYPSEDREAVETQVLAARRSVRPTLSTLPPEAMQREIERRISAMKDRDSNVAVTNELQHTVYKDIEREFAQQLLSIESGTVQRYEFMGLSDARSRGEPLTLRYRVNSGGNDPRAIYSLTVAFPEIGVAYPETISLATTMTMPVRADAVRTDGTLVVEIYNGDLQRNIPNPGTVTFPPDGIEVYFNDGSYQVNYLRIVFVQWLKLACISMLAIACATSLSFSVASLTAFGVFLIAETAGFLKSSLENYGVTDGTSNDILWHRLIIVGIAEPIAYVFQGYAGLTPVDDLVKGRILSWSSVAVGAIVLGAITVVLFLVAVIAFRRRELATYSGQ